jgi:hypothetical protein
MARGVRRSYLVEKIRKSRAKWARFRDRALLTHPTFTHALIDAPKPPVERPASGPALDAALIARACVCYRLASRDREGESPSMWHQIERDRADFVSALARADIAALGGFVEHMFRSKLLAGMAHAEDLFLHAENNPYARDYFRLRVTDCLLSLGEALAVQPVPSHAQMRLADYIDHLHADPAALFRRIEAALGFSLAAPAIGMPPGCRFDGVFTTPDLLRHAYTVHRMRGLGFGPEARILEIGGGFGAAALLALRAGQRSYTIIDLPFVGAIQMLYLGHAAGPQIVSGLGEAPGAVTLLPPRSIAALPDGSIDLVINTDSLPEIGRPAALDYMRQIRRIARGFLSINQEAQTDHPGVGRQNLVPALAEEVGGFARRHRFRHWMEQGYVEEYYAIER